MHRFGTPVEGDMPFAVLAVANGNSFGTRAGFQVINELVISIRGAVVYRFDS
jgi:hypothetical protein